MPYDPVIQFPRGALLCVLVIAGTSYPAVGTWATAQPSVQTPIFKSRVDVVRTEVAVIDNRTGKPVVGLTESDFTVSENGVRQTISSFLAEAGRANADAVAVETPSPDRKRRVFLLVFGTGHLDGPVHPYEGVVRFLRERLRPNDLAAVMVRSRVTTLTIDHEMVAQVVERFEHHANAINDVIRRDGVKREDLSAQNQAMVDGWLQPAGAPSDFLRSAAALLIGTTEYRQNEDITRWNNMLMFRDVLKISAGIEYLRNVQGEKHIVLFSNYGFAPPYRLINEGVGMRLDSREDDRQLAARANDAGVALDIIHTIGTRRGSYSTISSGNVAEHSGGQFTSLRTAAQQLARIDEATLNGYILGYVPMNGDLDGKYRTIKVDVERSGVTVVYRRGYTARADLPPVDPRVVLTRERLRDAATSDIPLDDIKVQAKATVVMGAGGARQTQVEVRIDPTALSLTLSNGRWQGKVDLMILCGDSKQNVVGMLDQQMTLSMDQARYEQARASGIPYLAVVPVTATPAHVKVLVYDYKSDRLGTTNVPVR